jgi:CheY-like chemotaxis protein
MKGIAVSGFGMDNNIRDSLEAGFSQHLTKPIKLDQLRAVIEQISRECRPTNAAVGSNGND